MAALHWRVLRTNEDLATSTYLVLEQEGRVRQVQQVVSTKSLSSRPKAAAQLPPNVEIQKGELELDAETLKWYASKEEERELIAEEARADQGEVTFAIGECLLPSWNAA